MSKNFAPLFIVFAAFLWSLDGVLRRSLGLSPLCIVFYEHLLGLLVLLPVLVKNRHEYKNLGAAGFWSLSWVALLGGFVGTWCYTSALAQVKYISFSVVVLLQQMQPIFAILLARFVLKEKLPPAFVGWAVLSLIGAYLISFKDLYIKWGQDGNTVKASLLALGAAFAWGSSTVFGKHMLKKVSPTTGTALRFLLTVVFILPVLLACQPCVPVYQLSMQQLGLFVAIACSAGMVSILFYYHGLRQVEAKVSTICELFFPFSAMWIDFLYYKKTFTWTQVVGCVLLLIAIYHVATQKKQHSESAA
jgi:drug/metabolite transporter (DMT)-like permease